MVLGLILHDFRLGQAWPALGWLALLALTSQVIGWLLITVSMPRLPAGMIGALLLVQPAGSVALSYAVLGERPSALQLVGVVLVLAGVLVAVGGRAQEPVAAADELMAAGTGADAALLAGTSGPGPDGIGVPGRGAAAGAAATAAAATAAVAGAAEAAGAVGDYSRRSTKIMRQASAASTGESVSKSP